METLHLQATDAEFAGKLLHDGRLVAFPTETVYGLGANALNADAVHNIYAAKGRPSDNPLIAHIADISTLPSLWRKIPTAAKILAEAFWPGPLTMIVQRTNNVPDAVTAGLDTVAVRFPSHPIAQAIIRAAGVPIAAPSANLSGHPSPTTFDHVVHDLEGRVDAIVDGGVCGVGLESTVVAIEQDCVRVLRPGGISPEMIAMVLDEAEVIIDDGVRNPVNSAPRSPGMKYRHYAPRASLTAYLGNPLATAKRIVDDCKKVENAAVMCYDEYADMFSCPTVPYGRSDNAEELAHNLFDALRTLDELDAKILFAQCPGDTGVYLAVSNRLKRAAGFHLIEVEDEVIE